MRKRLIYECLYLTYVLFLSFSVDAQTHSNKRLYVKDTLVAFPIVTLDVLNEDSLWNVHLQDTLDGAQRFGVEISVNYNLLNSGEWCQLNDSTRVWRLGIVSPNAIMMSVMFDEYFLPSGGQLLIYNANRSMLLGPYSEKNNQINGLFASALLNGDSLILEYYEPTTQMGNGSLSIGKVVHAYVDPFEKSLTGANCHTSVCDAPSGWCNQIRSVGLIVEGGQRICSGVLLTNVERNYRPYFLTALHCGDRESRDKNGVLDPDDIEAISQWVVYFNSLGAECSSANYPIHGATVKSYHFSSDYLLLEFNEPIPESVNVYYTGWNGKDIRPQETVSIHFPITRNGKKQIAFSNERPTQSRDRYYIGSAEKVASSYQGQFPFFW